MSKRRKRNIRKQRSRDRKFKVDVQKKDLHHIFYQRRYWRGNDIRELREFHYCKIYIPKQTLHKQIHDEVPNVPTPRPIIARQALKQLRLLEKYDAISDNDSLSRRLTVLIALFECADQPTADALWQQLDITNRFYEKLSD